MPEKSSTQAQTGGATTEQAPAVTSVRWLDAATFDRLAREGEQLSRTIRDDGRGMRIFNADELRVTCR